MESEEESRSPPTTPKKKAKVHQKYKQEWECQYEWLSRDPLCEFNAKCKICALTFTVSHAGVGQVKQHMASKRHKAKTEMRKSSGLLQKFFPKNTGSTSSLSYTSNEGIKVTAAELATTYHIIKHNLSYNSQDCNMKLNKIIYVDSKIASNIRLARTKMEALVTDVLGPHSLQCVIDQLTKDNVFYCLQTDASNKKNVKLFPLVIQYFTPEDGIQQKLLDFYENVNESANGMYSAIKNSLESCQLSFSQLSGLSADNTNANFGHNHSLYTNILEVVPDLIKGNCHAHIVHNSVKYAMNCLNYDIENIILKIYIIFSLN